MNSNKPQKTEVSLVEISAAQLNQRLDNFLFKRLGDVPRTRIYRIIRKGEVRVNKKRCKPEYKLQVGDQVRIPPLRLESAPEAKSRPSRRLQDTLAKAILFENRQILVIDKPSGLAVHSGSGLAYGVIDIMRQLRPGDDIELVHRLDRDTSGCLMLTKNRAALLELQQQLQGNAVKKNYSAVVCGRWPQHVIDISHRLKKYHMANGERRVCVDASGKTALSRVSILRVGAIYSIVQVEIVTGRTHQIRVHCQAEGHPIAGDDKYGDDAFNRSMRGRGIRRLMLHAASLELPETEFNPELVINAPLPPEFEQLINAADGSSAAVT